MLVTMGIMPNCYQCGCRLPSQLLLSRRVKTVEYITATYCFGKVQTVNKSFGLRFVCGSCAMQIDREKRRDEQMQVAGSLAILTVAVAIYLWQLLFGK